MIGAEHCEREHEAFVRPALLVVASPVTRRKPCPAERGLNQGPSGKADSSCWLALINNAAFVFRASDHRGGCAATSSTSHHLSRQKMTNYVHKRTHEMLVRS